MFRLTRQRQISRLADNGQEGSRWICPDGHPLPIVPMRSKDSTEMSSDNITVYRGVRVTRQSLTTMTDGSATTTYSYKAHPRNALVTADSQAEIHEKMDVVLSPRS